MEKDFNKITKIQELILPLLDKEELRFKFDELGLNLTSYFANIDHADNLIIYLPGLEGISEDYDKWLEFLCLNSKYKSDVLLVDIYGFRRKGVFKMSDEICDKDDVVDLDSATLLDKIKNFVLNPTQTYDSYYHPLKASYSIAKTVFNNNPNSVESLTLYRRFVEIYKEYLLKVNKEYLKITIIANSTGGFLSQDIIRYNKEMLDKITCLILEQPVQFIKKNPEMPEKKLNFDFWMILPRLDLPKFRFPFVYAGDAYNKSARECIQTNIGYYLCYAKSSNIKTVSGKHGRIKDLCNPIIKDILQGIFKDAK